MGKRKGGLRGKVPPLFRVPPLCRARSLPPSYHVALLLRQGDKLVQGVERDNAAAALAPDKAHLVRQRGFIRSHGRGAAAVVVVCRHRTGHKQPGVDANLFKHTLEARQPVVRKLGGKLQARE